MWAWLAGAAAAGAPSRVVDAFDLAGPDWVPAEVSTAPDGSGSLVLDGSAVGQRAFVVTHKRVSVRLFASDVWPVRVTATVDEPISGFGTSSVAWAPVSRWTTVTLDTSDLCGLEGGASLSVDALPSYGEERQPVYVDAVQLDGEVCPQFHDADADGLCVQGHDRDGDGWCVAEDEVEPPGHKLDCNDTSPGPRCLALAVVPHGVSATLTATGAAPGETVTFFGSGVRGQNCPPALGGVCMDLGLPRRLGAATADDAGAAVFAIDRLDIPWFQAAVLRLAQETDVSPATALDGPAPEPTPITDR
jgi:hypothetical protein